MTTSFHSNKPSVRWAGIIGLSLFALIPLGFAIIPAWHHFGTVTHWPKIDGIVTARTIEDRPSVGYRRSSVMSHSIRDAYVIQRGGKEQVESTHDVFSWDEWNFGCALLWRDPMAGL